MKPNEQVISYTVDYTMNNVYAIVGTKDSEGSVISNRSVNFGPEGFNMLMEEKPSWSPAKPKNNFYMEDLVTVIDLLESE